MEPRLCILTLCQPEQMVQELLSPQGGHIHHPRTRSAMRKYVPKTTKAAVEITNGIMIFNV